MNSPKRTAYPWVFPARFRRNAYGWKSSRLAIERLKEALAEIHGVARQDPLQAADGAVKLIERLSPALEQVDSSSGALGTAVNRALEELATLIAAAPADATQRQHWLERLYDAHAADQIPYIETLADHWGALCVTQELANHWADRLLGITRRALSPDKSMRGHFHGTTACLDALLKAERYADLHELLATESFWPYKRWAVKALAAEGKPDDAIALAEASRGPWTNDGDVDRLCEGILMSQGRAEDAYRRYGLDAHRQNTNLATFRALAKRYPQKLAADLLTDLIATTPGEEGKWFATAKDAGLYDLALELARRSPTDPKTLTRAARDFATKQPAFALGAGMAALRWISQGHGYELTTADVWAAYTHTLKAAERLGTVSETSDALRELLTTESAGGIVTQVLAQHLGLPGKPRNQ